MFAHRALPYMEGGMQRCTCVAPVPQDSRHPTHTHTGCAPGRVPHNTHTHNSQRSRTPLSQHQHHAGTGGRERGLAMLPVPKVWNLMAAEGSRGQPRLLCVPSIFDGDHLTNAAVARKKSVVLQSPDLALSSLTRRDAAQS